MLKPETLTAVIDTREQTPLDLSPLHAQRGTLTTGDYSLRGLEGIVTVERKGLPDLLACIGRERERFEREIKRLLAYPVRALVIETDWQEIERGTWRSKLKPAHVIGALIGWQCSGLPIWLSGDHDRAGRIVAKILYTAARRRLRENEQLTKTLEKK